MGKREIIKHAESKVSSRPGNSDEDTNKSKFFCQRFSDKTTEAELKMAVLTAACNIPLAFHDKLSPAIRAGFNDSRIAKTILCFHKGHLHVKLGSCNIFKLILCWMKCACTHSLYVPMVLMIQD